MKAVKVRCGKHRALPREFVRCVLPIRHDGQHVYRPKNVRKP